MNIIIKKILIKYKIPIASVLVLVSVIVFFIYQNNTSNSLSGMLHYGEKMENTGKYATAMDVYQKAVRIYPHSYEAHIRLGNVYRLVNEPEKAKLEYYRAIKISKINRYDAYFYMADVYVSENEFELAEDTLLQIKGEQKKAVVEKIGDFYENWGSKLKETNSPESIRKYKIAVNYYKISNLPKLIITRKSIEDVYIEISNALLKVNNLKEAEKILNISIDYHDNARAHYHLARIYQKTNIDKAIKEYTKAFDMYDKVADKSEFVHLLVTKADGLYKNGDKTAAELYYTRAKKINPQLKVDMLADNQIIVNLIATKSNKNQLDDLYTPGVSFKITNISKQEIKLLKTKVIFNIHGKKFSERICKVIAPDNPLPAYSISSPVNIYSPVPVSTMVLNPSMEIFIYISIGDNGKWKLYRTAYFENN
jgi:tetratricopeptide (TPR) repeat protein